MSLKYSWKKLYWTKLNLGTLDLNGSNNKQKQNFIEMGEKHS